MPFVTFTVRRGLGAADKYRLSEAMLEAQVSAGYHRADREPCAIRHRLRREPHLSQSRVS
jgi:hypothetical protein